MSVLKQIKRVFSRPPMGFLIDEVMTGTHQFAPGFGEPGEKRMEFYVTWGARSFADWLNPRGEAFLRHELRGVVGIEGLCTSAPCVGTLTLMYFSGRKIRYDFTFEHEGKTYRFLGDKRDIWPWNLHRTHTTCYGELFEQESGALVSTSVTHFDLRTTLSFLRSFRLERGGLLSSSVESRSR